MCSGCSGDFEGGDWEREEQEDDQWAACDPEGFWHRLRERYRALEGASAAAGGGAGPGPSAEEEWDVWVSRERIIERRTVRARSFVVAENGAETARAQEGSWGAGDQQLQSGSAKYYRTFPVLGPNRSNGLCAAGPWPFWQHCAAAVLLAALIFWIAAR